jgi:hypothetical protein
MSIENLNNPKFLEGEIILIGAKTISLYGVSLNWLEILKLYKI